MKKTLVAIAALAAVSAFAQSSVTIGGAFGAGYQSAPNKTKGFAFTDADLNIGVVEDLGGGLTARLATTLQTTGDNFRSGVLRGNTSLGLASASMGTFGFSHTRSSDLMTQALVAPASLPDGIYDSTGILARGAIDGVGYTSPNFSGFTFNASYIESGANPFSATTEGIACAPATNASACAGVPAGTFLGGFSTDGSGTVNSARKTWVLGAAYANGPLMAAVSFKSGKNDDTLYPALKYGATDKKTNFELVTTYDLGVAKLGFGIDSATKSKPAAAVAPAASAAYRTYRADLAASKMAFGLGVSAPFGPVTVGANYAKRGENKMYELVAKYDFSKRTNLNVSAGKQSGIGAVSGGQNSGYVTATALPTDAFGAAKEASQFRIRLMHTF